MERADFFIEVPIDYFCISPVSGILSLSKLPSQNLILLFPVLIYTQIPCNGVQIPQSFPLIVIAGAFQKAKEGFLRDIFRNFTLLQFKIAVAINLIVLLFDFSSFIHGHALETSFHYSITDQAAGRCGFFVN